MFDQLNQYSSQLYVIIVDLHFPVPFMFYLSLNVFFTQTFNRSFVLLKACRPADIFEKDVSLDLFTVRPFGKQSL